DPEEGAGMGDPGAEGVAVDAQGGCGLLRPRVVVEPGAQRVFERGAVVDVKPQFDITRQVIERMNQLR
ncbi:hypothetical protein QML21_30015, partial [Klebsiella pneumoniae]